MSFSSILLGTLESPMSNVVVLSVLRKSLAGVLDAPIPQHDDACVASAMMPVWRSITIREWSITPMILPRHHIHQGWKMWICNPQVIHCIISTVCIGCTNLCTGISHNPRYTCDYPADLPIPRPLERSNFKVPYRGCLAIRLGCEIDQGLPGPKNRNYRRPTTRVGGWAQSP